MVSAFKDRWTQIDENEGQMIRHISPGTQMTKAEFVSAMLNGRKNYFPLTGTFTPYILSLAIAYIDYPSLPGYLIHPVTTVR